MKIVPTLLISTLLIAAAGSAQAESMRGKIRSVDTDANRFTLTNGLAFNYSDEVDEAQLQKDARIKVKYRQKSGKLVVRHVRVIGAPQG